MSHLYGKGSKTTLSHYNFGKTSTGRRRRPRKPVCVHCGAEVWWGFPRPEDKCLECGKPIGEK